MTQAHKSLATIPNRYAFIDMVSRSAARSESLSLMLVDVVRFSDVTTSLGITVGDRFLLEIVNRIDAIFKDSVEIGRISGDVFGLIFPNINAEKHMRKMFDRLVEHFKTPMHHDGHAFIADFNVGVVSARQINGDITAFVSRGEAALKQAKENKYDNLFILDMQDKTTTGRSLALKADLKRALSRKELELYFQPKVNLKTLEVIGAECLMRWNHPVDGILFPGPLIEAAESYNMMNELGYWTLEQAFISLVEFATHGLDLSLSVNLSPTQLYDNQLVSTLKKLSEQYVVPLNKIELELTEDVALSNSLMVKKQLNELRFLGVEISVDDFGKGYSNLAYIRELDIDAIKIDKSFVMELTDDPVNRAIIEATQIIGKAKDCDVIAEGIETMAQLHMLREVGITQGQGYLFSKAIPIHQFLFMAQQEIIIGNSPLRA